VCSGIEAATVAWHPLGWTAAAYSEIEKFPSQVLAHHYPDVPNVGDMTKFKEWNIGAIDLLVGGTPCQSFSVAGLRKGLDDPRGNLMLTFLAIADQHRPRWLVWENVPGVLSSNGGKDFGTFLGALGELGYGFAYRILDAQYFGVAQRRRRVFVVGYLGDWRVAAAVLFERHSLSGDSAPSREKREGAAANARESSEVGSLIPAMHSELCPSLKARDAKGPSSDGDGDGAILVPMAQPIAYAFDSLSSNSMKSANPVSGCNKVEISKSLDTSRGLDPSCNQGGIGVAQPISFSAQMSNPQTDVEMSATLQAKKPMAVAVGTDLYNGAITGDVACTMSTHGGDGNGTGPTVMQQMAVRRLTPVECERLQGFPDNYTDIQLKGKVTPDGPRYKALGNSMAVPVMAWIGKRIQEVEQMQCKPNR